MTENGDPQDNPHRAVGGEATTYRCVFVQRVRKIKFGVASEKCTRDTGIRKVIFFQPPLPSFNHAVASTSKRCWSADGRCGRGVCGPACSCLGWSCVCACCWISTAAVVTLHTCACRSGEGEHNRGEVTLTHSLARHTPRRAECDVVRRVQAKRALLSFCKHHHQRKQQWWQHYPCAVGLLGLWTACRRPQCARGDRLSISRLVCHKRALLLHSAHRAVLTFAQLNASKS
jgi:hypothetical protein